jgi:hypothetical protein
LCGAAIHGDHAFKIKSGLATKGKEGRSKNLIKTIFLFPFGSRAAQSFVLIILLKLKAVYHEGTKGGEGKIKKLN